MKENSLKNNMEKPRDPLEIPKPYKRFPLTREQVYRLLKQEELWELEPWQVLDYNIYHNSDK